MKEKIESFHYISRIVIRDKEAMCVTETN